MKNKQIFFTAVHTAELVDGEIRENLNDNEVMTVTEYTVISGGTERANIMGMQNVSGIWPRGLGYCGVGYVVKTGKAVTKVKEGDRVLVYHGCHSKYNIRPDGEITKVEQDITSLEAAFVIIAAMGLGGVRKLELELGESAMVMGQGLLGIFATQFLRLSGANPLIAADLNPQRRELALSLGADYAFDPSESNFIEKVKEVTKGKGVRGTVEVTGVSKAMCQALECASWQGRISLLGCTRVSDCPVDYYQQVHKPGIKLIGAHNFVRPKFESYPHHWTHHDDCNAIMDMIASKRVKVEPIISRVVSPTEAPEIFNELCDDPNFPIGTVFDWRNTKV
ncbi:MAG: zinc-binding alcohol dehydrogenase [Ruminococcaceae bacterium]|nr:zinc-binding alcohol dehydrogenase [Oscillospiraceae bacterium]